MESLENLTEDQVARLPGHVHGWLQVALSTQPADRANFVSAARRLYQLSGLHWHNRVVWVSSPQVLLLAGPPAARIWGGDLDPKHLPAAWERVEAHFGEEVAAGCREAVEAALPRFLKARDLRINPADRLDPRGIGLKVASSFLAEAYFAQSLSRGRAIRTLTGALAALNFTEGSIQRAIWSAALEGWRTLEREEPVYQMQLPWHWQIMGSVVFGVRMTAHRMEAGGVHVAALTSFLCDVLPPGQWQDRRELCQAYEQTVRHAGWWYPHRDFLMVCERPREIHLQSVTRPNGTLRGQQLHREEGPALTWGDGWGVHALRGVQVPAWVVEQPQRITVAAIEQAENAEQRRILLERYGWTRFMQDCGATVVDSIPMDHPIRGLRGARLLRKDLPGDIEPLLYLEMVNSTPEPDGSHRRYLERIDPKAYQGEAAHSAHAAMASRWRHREANGTLVHTFERWQDYLPTGES